jgi:hypothetical protein
MAITVTSKIKDYLVGLPATNLICSTLGTTLTSGSNLFINYEPEASSCITILTYGGASPRGDKYKYEANFQMRVKNSSREKAESVSQAIINDLSYNTSAVTKGLITANNSIPILLAVREGGEQSVFVSNFTIKYVKIES